MDPIEGPHRRESDHDGDHRPEFHDFYELIKHRVSRILLVSSLYDAFTLEEEGLIFEQISGEYRNLELPFPPQVVRVSSGGEAIAELRAKRYDLVITMARISDMEPNELGRAVKEVQDIPVLLLLTEMADIQYYHRPGVHDGVDRVFYWSGDSALYLAITKYIEDSLNIEQDTATGLVRVILVVEDSPRFYSVFLPLIYTEIMRQTRDLVAEVPNEREKRLRLRSRPKIVLAETYEEALERFGRYRPYVMGVISDAAFPRGGEVDGSAGFRLFHELRSDVPFLLQSSEVEHGERARALGITFIDKGSGTLLQELREFFKRRLGFGDFVFTMPDGREVARASDIRGFLDVVRDVPTESLMHHGAANNFSNWLMARGEISLASSLRHVKVTDFGSGEEVREFLLASIRESRRLKQMGAIIEFERQDFEFDQTFTRLGGGSLGGKGRGIAFLSSLLKQSMMDRRIMGCELKVPETLVIATDEFDRFMRENDLTEFSNQDLADGEMSRRFLDADISDDLRAALARYLDHMRRPIAVRSSSLLEDSQNQPFAGLYSTYILPNNCGDPGARLDQLVQAVKLVYASAFYRRVKAYIRSAGLLPEEEKMAVVIQDLIGNQHGGRFYPLVSGVAQSHNFYPVHPLGREEGIASVALGLGKIVVEGERVLSFSPAHPDVVPGFHSPQDVMKNSQRHFYALDMSRTCFDLSEGEGVTLLSLGLSEAEEDGTLDLLGSTYVPDDNIMRDGLGRDGPRAVTFAGILRHGAMPLARALGWALDTGLRGMGRPVEMEFAVRANDDARFELFMVQIRPLVTMRERMNLSISEDDVGRSVVSSDRVNGNGMVEGICDIVYVVPATFDPTATVDIAREIGLLNRAIGRPYLLIGPGRWGTRDRFLGIPVDWDQISWAKAMVEISLEHFRVDPSHGTHFFHNITALGIPYFSVPFGAGARVDWEWLERSPSGEAGRWTRHVRLASPLVVKVDGRTGTGVVLRPPE